MEIEPEFSKFWEFYPKKKSKGDAYKAWIQTASKRPRLGDLLAAIVVLKNSADWKRDDGQYVPYPGSWLRAWGWADVPETDRAEVRGGEMWWATSSGVEAKGKELGLTWDALHHETFQQFTARVKHEASQKKIAPLKATA